jgi:hypothetical protein
VSRELYERVDKGKFLVVKLAVNDKQFFNYILRGQMQSTSHVLCWQRFLMPILFPVVSDQGGRKRPRACRSCSISVFYCVGWHLNKGFDIDHVLVKF